MPASKKAQKKDGNWDMEPETGSQGGRNMSNQLGVTGWGEVGNRERRIVRPAVGAPG